MVKVSETESGRNSLVEVNEQHHRAKLDTYTFITFMVPEKLPMLKLSVGPDT